MTAHNDTHSGNSMTPSPEILELAACPFCSEENTRFSEPEWKDDRRYIQMTLECCSCEALMSEQFGWSKCRDKTDADIKKDLQAKLAARWNTRTPSPDAGLREAMENLVSALEAVHAHPRYKVVWETAHFRIGPYDGPTYTRELAAAKAALSPAPAMRGEGG